MKVLLACLGVISLLLFSYANAGVEQCMENKNVFASESSFSSDDPSLPFVIDVKLGGNLYQDAKWSLKILDVVADGKHVVGKPSFEFFDDINVDSKKIDGGFFVYKIRFDNMIFGDLSADGEYTLIEYPVESDVRELEIKYQFMYSGGDLDSRVYTLKAFRIR